MMNVKKSVTMLVAVAAIGVTCAVMAPLATADDVETVTSSRSFPKVTTVKKDLFAEATSTEVDADADWGGIESLDVPQTKSAAEIAAEEQAAAEEEARQAAAAAAASRSAERDSLSSGTSATTTTVTPPASATGASLASYATQFVGAPYAWGGSTPSGWDCSGFVMYVFAQFGVSLPHSSGAMMSVGSPVGSLAEAQPGDIITNSSHAAIYIGNGMVVNALNVGQGTQITSVSTSFYGSYAIRRVL